MYKNGRGNSSRSGRRGNVRRKQYVGIIAAVLVIYIVYRSFKSDSDETKFESLKTSKLSQKIRVQGELRNKAMESEKPFNARPDLTRAEVVGDIIIEGDIKSNEEKSGDDNNNSPAGGEVIPGLTDRYHLAKSALDEINQKDLTQDNTTSIKSNKTFSSESAQPKDPVISLNITKVTRNLTETNLTLSHEPAEHTDPVSQHNNGNITFKTTTLNTSSIHGVETGNRGSHGVVNNDVEEYKVKLTEEFAAQTKQLVLLMKETLTKNGTSLLEFKSQNKTNLDKNVTNFVESFSAKANNVLSLAKNLLMDRNRNIPSTNQSNLRLNDTQLEKLFSMESQDIVKYANEMFSKTNETGLEEKGDAKAKFLDKYSFQAQQLRKFASTLLSNQTKLVANTQQKLLNIELPKDSKLPAQTSNMTARMNYKLNSQ